MDISTPEKLLGASMGFSYASAAIIYVVFRSLEISIRRLIKTRKGTYNTHA